MKYIHEKLGSKEIQIRIIYTAILFLFTFFGIMILSYLFLPEGLLKNKNPLQNWNTSDNTIILTMQIFFFNMLSVIMLFIGSLFAKKKPQEKNYLSIGYTAFFIFISINAVVLGTWSFSVRSEAIPILDRIVKTFDLLHRAGLWEMTGQLFITCALANIAVVLTNGKSTTMRKLKDIRLSKAEMVVLILGFVLMLTGAIIESIAINHL